MTDISKIPMAYLLGETELNADATNFWIFSEAGLRRIVERANWRVVAFRTIGDTEGSDPVSLDHDERAFCLLESVYGMGHLDYWMGGMCRSQRVGDGRKEIPHAIDGNGDGDTPAVYSAAYDRPVWLGYALRRRRMASRWRLKLIRFRARRVTHGGCRRVRIRWTWYSPWTG